MVKLISKQIAVSTLEPSIRLDDVLRSYDLEDTQFEIKVLNEDLDLTDATIHCVTKYFSHGKSYAFEKLVKPKSKDVIVFSLPEELKGYDGKIYVGLYAELGDERVDIKDIEVTINNSIIDEDIDFSTVNYFESFERMVEKVDLATEDALDNIKHDKEHVALSRDYAERKMDEDIEEVDTRAKEVLESINDKDKKVNELADKLNTDIEDFEQIKITAKETSDNAVREISQTKDTVISEIESVSDSFKAKKTEFDTVVNGITTSIDTKAKDLGTYTEEQKLHIDEKTKSFNTLVDEKTGELTKLNNTFNQELEKAGVTLTTAQDLINRIGTLEQKEDKDTVYNDTEIKQSVADVDTKVDNLSEKVTALEERPIVDTALTERVEALERKEDKDTVYDDTDIKERISALEQKEDKDTIYDDSNLKAQIVELESKLQSLNTVRRAPTSYTLDRTTTPWTIWFDNGCGLQFPEYPKTGTIYGYGFKGDCYNTNISTYPLPPIIMSVSHGTLTLEKLKSITNGGYADYWGDTTKVINSINYSYKYNWDNARFNKEALSHDGYTYNRQKNLIRVMYELGIWSDEEVLSLGATKK